MMFKSLSAVIGIALLAACGDGEGNSKSDGAPPVVKNEAGVTIAPDGGSPPPPPPTCDKDWLLGSTFYTCPDCGMGQACDPSGAPKNCADGSFIKFNDGECRCVVNCGSFPSKPGVGDTCDKEGKWHCQQITNGNGSSGLMCVPDAWNLCTEGSGPQPPPPAADAGAPPPNCKPADEICSEDIECCSGTCFGTCF